MRIMLLMIRQIAMTSRDSEITVTSSSSILGVDAKNAPTIGKVGMRKKCKR